MQPQFIGHGLEHHGLHAHGAMQKEGVLLAHNEFRRAQNAVKALLHIFHKTACLLQALLRPASGGAF